MPWPLPITTNGAIAHPVTVRLSKDNMSEAAAKICPGCGAAFTVEDLIESPEVEPVGIQFVDTKLLHNVYYFNHRVAQCGTTFVVAVELFTPFLQEEPAPESLAGTDLCENHCRNLDDQSECQQGCRYASHRRFLHVMKQKRVPVAL
ncbi:MAG TPA: hypothetical protein VNN55_09875 [bacterium]|nr:hypothetical protein [bacterium]